MKKRKTHIRRSRVFQLVLKGGENKNFAFVILKTTFSKYQLIKISITHVYIEPEVDTKIIQQQWLQPQMKPA